MTRSWFLTVGRARGRSLRGTQQTAAMLIAARRLCRELGDGKLGVLVTARVLVRGGMGVFRNARSSGCEVCIHCRRQGQGFDPAGEGENQACGNEFRAHGISPASLQHGKRGTPGL